MDKRKGFTIVEVALFLAITAALFIGIALAMQNSITQQRFNDATQSFYEFMRSIYSKVSNPQSPGYGNSEEAIYGKLVVFGEKYDIIGSNIEKEESIPVFVYDVVGDVDHIGGLSFGTVTGLLEGFNADVIKVERDKATGDVIKADLATPEKYEMRWQMTVQDIDGNPFKGSLLVVRHPSSGTIYTLFYDETIEVNKFNSDEVPDKTAPDAIDVLKKNLKNFTSAEIDFCLSAYGFNENGLIPRRNIRILEDARNASAVELIEEDKEYVADGKDGSQEGNRCLKE